MSVYETTRIYGSTLAIRTRAFLYLLRGLGYFALGIALCGVLIFWIKDPDWIFALIVGAPMLISIFMFREARELFALVRELKTHPRLELTSEGIFVRLGSVPPKNITGFLRWENLKSVEQITWKGIFPGVEIAGAIDPIAELTPDGSDGSGYDFNIRLRYHNSEINTPPGDVYEAVRFFWENPQQRSHLPPPATASEEFESSATP